MSSYPPPLSTPPSDPQPPVVMSPWGPFSAGDLLRRTFALYREHTGVVLGISAVCAGLLTAAQLPAVAVNFLITARTHQDPAKVLSAAWIVLLLALVVWIVTCAIYALAGGALFSSVLRWRLGQNISVSEALTESSRRLGPAFRALLLITLRMIGWYFLIAIPAIIVIAIIAGVSGLASAGKGAAPGVVFIGLVVLAALAVIIFMVWTLLRYSVAVPVVYAEGAGASASIRRSIELTRGSKGRLAALMGFLMLISFVFVIVLLAVTMGPMLRHAATLQTMSAAPATPVTLAMSLAQLAISAVILVLFFFPVGGLGVSLCYLDLRARKDAVPQAPPPLGWAPVAQPGAPTEPAQSQAPYEPPYPPAASQESYPSTRASSLPDHEPRRPFVDSPRSFRSDPGPTKHAPASDIIPPHEPAAPEAGGEPPQTDDATKGLEPPHEAGTHPLDR